MARQTQTDTDPPGVEAPDETNGPVDSFDALLEAAVRPSDASEDGEPHPSRFVRLAHGSRVSGRFTVEWYAGAGGMGDVYRCHDLETRESVALKVIRKVVDQGRFRREAAILATLGHEAIVRYVAHGTTETATPYLAMEWLEGEDLGKQLRRQRLSVPDCVRLSRRIVGALSLAHGYGYVHRDIKPSNVFLGAGKVEHAKLLDFGIAHRGAATQTATRAGTVLGTVGYMAPDQASGVHRPDPRDDLFSLGCVMFECLTGRPAFVGDSSLSVLDAVLHEEPPSLLALRGDVPAELAALIRQLLRKTRGERPLDAASVLRALERIEASAAVAPNVCTAECPWRAAATELTVLAHVQQTTSAPSLDRADPWFAALASRFEASLVRGSETSLGLAFATSPTRALVDVAEQAVACGQIVCAERADLSVSVVCLGDDGAGVTPHEHALRLATATTTAPRAGLRVHPVVAGLLRLRSDLSVGEAERVGADGTASGSSFVGRELEQAVVEAVYRESADERVARALVVGGAAGMGKSRLALECLAMAQEEGAQLLLVSASPHERLVAHAVVRQIARQLARTSGELTHRPEPLDLSDRLARACDERALVVCIDDAQWVDDASMKQLAASLSVLADRPLFLLGLLRPCAEQRAAWLGMGAHDLQLRPLHARAAEQLVGACLPGATAARVAQLARIACGSPRLLSALVAAESRASEPVARAAELLVLERLGQLESVERSALCAASVCGAQFGRASVAAILPGEVELSRALAALCTHGLLTCDAAIPEHYAFTHPIVREAALRVLSTVERHHAEHCLARVEGRREPG